MSDDAERNEAAADPGREQAGGQFEAAAAPAPSEKQQPSYSPRSLANNPAASIVCYCASSILMTVANKYLMSRDNFNLTFILLLVQSIVCVSAISIAKAFGFIHFRDFNSDEARKWFPISALLIGMVYTSLRALQYLSIPVYTIYKNITIILIAYGEVFWFGGRVTGMALLSFGLIVLSSVVAAWADIRNALVSYSGDATTGEAAEKVTALNWGYVWMFLNCLTSAAYVLAMRKRITLMNFKDFDTMFYNHLLSVPILIVACLYLEDLSPSNLATNFPDGRETFMISAIIFNGFASTFISYSTAWIVRVTSSTTSSMVGALNKLPIAVSGLVFFHAPATFGSITAIFLGFVSGIVYAVAKVRQKSADESEKLSTILPMTRKSGEDAREPSRP